MKRLIVMLAWLLIGAGIGLSIGASLYAFFLYFLGDPGARPASWPGWNILFFVFVVGFPLASAALVLLLGSTGRLPGTRRT
jgi:hypothetical protein